MFQAKQYTQLSIASPKSPSMLCRDHWPSHYMRAFMARSIALMDNLAEQTGNAFKMQRPGYLYTSSRPGALAALTAEATECHGSAQSRAEPITYADAAGATERRIGADVYDGDAARSRFPFLSGTIGAAMHVRNAGWVR